VIAHLVTCEHGGTQVPVEYEDFFEDWRTELRGHRGHDSGALELAGRLANRLSAPLVFSTTTRLLVDLNRSPGHPKLFSEVTQALDAAEKERILENWYWPHRFKVECRIHSLLARAHSVVHLAVHTFTPVLNCVERRADAGLLFDPARHRERQYATRLRKALVAQLSEWTVRFNYPYRGKADGLTTWLRRRLRTSKYLGIEIEVNQRHVAANGTAWTIVRDGIADAAEKVAREWVQSEER
jgi:predicted N-formylglutamate amidohydrolase